MAISDVLIQAGGTEAVPFDYELAPAAEFAPKAVRALFDGTAAASSYLPCLVILGPTDHEVARIPTDTVVAAGASAVVSWFPHVGGGGGSTTASPLAYAYCHLDETDAPQVISTGIATNVQFQHFQTSDVNTFGTEVSNGLPLPGPPGNNTAGDAGLGLYKPGLYSIHLQTVWTGSGGGYYHQNRISQGFDAPGLQLDRVGTITTAATPDMFARDNQLWLRDDGMGLVTGQAALALQVFQTSGGNVNLLSGKMAAYYYGPLSSGTPGSYG